ncbi:MAG: nucleoside triphosphate pyrophosphohydrolase [Patescibacteria group bacterium]
MRQYNKLVRDRILEIIEKDDVKPIWHKAGRSEYWKKLKEKLVEEVNEFLDSKKQEELADVLEVIDAISDLWGFKRARTRKIKNDKKRRRGGFKKRIILEKA